VKKLFVCEKEEKYGWPTIDGRINNVEKHWLARRPI